MKIRKPNTGKLPQVGWRIGLFLCFVTLGFGLVVYQLVNLTFINHASLAETAKSQYNNPTALLTGRGNIYLSDLSSGIKVISATNITSMYVYTTGYTSDDPENIADKLAGILNNDKETLKNAIESKKYSVLASDLTKSQIDQIQSLKIQGIAMASQVERLYGFGYLTAHVLGFVGFNGKQRQGQYGVEANYDDILSGVNKSQAFWGNTTYSALVNFFKSLVNSSNNVKAGATVRGDNGSNNSDGSDLVLTVDKNIQTIAETKLNDVMDKWHAEAGSVIIEDPMTGEILAMVASPSYDDNNYGEFPLQNFPNPTVQSVYEPGSSFKPITMAAALDTGVVTPDTTYDDTGAVEVGGFTIKNFNNKANGIQTMRQVLEHSLNTGAIFAENRAGDDTFLNYVVAFGFGQKSGVDLSGEVNGNIANLYSGRKVNFSTASFGQGISATPLQVVNAYAAIANGGKLMWPHIVKQIIHPDGSIENIKPKIIGNPIKESTSLSLKSMLVDVVDKGFDKARIKGYDVAGKTGTAQIPSADGGYLGNDQFIHNFVGFAPAYDPRFVILIKIDKPKGITFASDSLSPVFGDLTRYLLHYFDIPPTRN